jgi:hypothetical protein
MAGRLRRQLVVTASGCWEWQGAVMTSGYGHIRLEGRYRVTHRVAMWVWRDFDLDSPLLVCHHCDNPLCFNPDHLFVGTYRDNTADMIRKGRALWQK